MTLGGVFAAESAHGMPLPTKFFVSPMRRPGETLGLEWGWLFKAGAVSRPGSPSPAASPMSGLSARSSPSKSMARKPAQAQAASAAQAAQAAGAKLAEEVRSAKEDAQLKDGLRKDGVHAPTAKRASVDGNASASAPKNAADGHASPTAGKAAPGTNHTRPAPQPVQANSTEEEVAHAKSILASSSALALPEAQGGMSHGVPGLVIEELREHLHVHECDKRLTLTELRALFPHYTFPAGPDEDTVWKPTGRETEDEMVARAGRGLEILFDMAQNDRYVSLTAHSGLLRAVYKNLGIPYRRLVTGEMNVLVIRVHRIPDLPNGESSAH